MHFSDSPYRSAPVRAALLTVCALLPAFTREAAAGGVRLPALGRPDSRHIPVSPSSTSASVSTPYLRVGPPPGLRFAEPVKLAAPLPAPAAMSDPPVLDDIPDESTAPDQSIATTQSDPLPAPPASPPLATPPMSANPVPAAIRTAPSPGGISILPDDTPRAIRAEDVLVYFQFPAAPTSGEPPPRSSATYQQK